MVPSWSSMYSYYRSLPKRPDGDFYSCAIRLSMCLHHAGAFNKSGYKKSGHKVSRHGWAMLAEEFYQWLCRHELGAPSIIPVNASDSSRLPRQNGIIYLRNCYPRLGETLSTSGDHLDLYISGQGALSAILWPADFDGDPFDLITHCRDGKIRFWPAV